MLSLIHIYDCGSREEGEKDGDNPGLKRALHGMRCRVPEANTSEEFRPNYCLFSDRNSGKGQLVE